MAPAAERPNTPWRTLATWHLRSEPGNERQAMQLVADVVQELALPRKRLDALKTAVSEATANAIEHGNQSYPERLVAIEVRASDTAVCVRITDEGGGAPGAPEVPDLRAKLAGQQTPRGWGLYLIGHLVDEVGVIDGEAGHTVELIMYRGT